MDQRSLLESLRPNTRTTEQADAALSGPVKRSVNEIKRRRSRHKSGSGRPVWLISAGKRSIRMHGADSRH